MTLIDAGPMIALIDRDDDDHQLCVASLPAVGVALVTTLAAVTEAMHILGARVGWRGQEQLMRLILRGDVQVLELDLPSLDRARVLMEKYSDLPMDFADATLVAVAEARGTCRVFTLDSDFRVYRYRGTQPFDLIP